MGKNIGKNTSKNLSGKYNQQLLDHAKHSAADALKSSSKRLIKKQQKQLVIWWVIKFYEINYEGLKKVLKVPHKHLQMSMIKKYLKKYIFF